jgi:hypothetical protein
MTRFKELVALLLLALSIAVAPVACGDGSDNGDGSTNNMTPG